MYDRMGKVEVSLTVNSQPYRRSVEPRLLLTDFLRHELGLTGTHVGCEHGVCGACTILVDDEPVRACLMLAVQANGCSLTTVEGLAPSSTELHPLQEAFWEAHGLQCGFCTPGILISMTALLRENPRPIDEEIRAGLAGNLCRCTGYQNIVKAIRIAADRLGMALTPNPLSLCAGEGNQTPPLPRQGEGVGG
jgi:aerobic-type carbon monoxide dehydrogenase small subunit (CoxS/CutS family)